MNRAVSMALALLAWLAIGWASPAGAQDANPQASPFGVLVGGAPAPGEVSVQEPASAAAELERGAVDATAASAAPGPEAPASGEGGGATAAFLDSGRLSTAVEIAILLTILTLLPAILITVTSFTRIVIVLSFVRRALSTNDLPPTQVILGLSLFLTAFVMAPVGGRIAERVWKPYRAGELTMEVAGERTWDELSGFLLANTRPSELGLFRDIAHMEEETEAARPPLRVLVPAFVLSELKTSFQMGFLLFLPFLVIDMVVASVLLSMGMFMLPPVMISTPFKILLFVLVDGWHLVCGSLVDSFVTT